MSEFTSILIVDDDETYRSRLVRAFTERGFTARGAPDGERALMQAKAEPPQRVVADLRMPGMSGLDFVREIKALLPQTRIVVLTAYGSIASAIEAVRIGAAHYLTKPADADDILGAFDRPEQPVGDLLGDEYEAPSLARLEWEHINRVLTDCGGNISKAARVLGIHRRSLQRKLAKYPVPK